MWDGKALLTSSVHLTCSVPQIWPSVPHPRSAVQGECKVGTRDSGYNSQGPRAFLLTSCHLPQPGGELRANNCLKLSRGAFSFLLEEKKWKQFFSQDMIWLTCGPGQHQLRKSGLLPCRSLSCMIWGGGAEQEEEKNLPSASYFILKRIKEDLLYFWVRALCFLPDLWLRQFEWNGVWYFTFCTCSAFSWVPWSLALGGLVEHWGDHEPGFISTWSPEGPLCLPCHLSVQTVVVV